ncbi:LysM domain-containing protein [Colletotrichum cereale]|nr:LysM domain-containing protein [Colletotrichum cereale]
MQISAIFSILAAVGVVSAAPHAKRCDVDCPGPIVDYVVKSNDTLTSIAATYNSGICQIATLNHIADPNTLPVAITLKVPTNLCEPDNTSCLTKPGQAQCVVGGPVDWTIRAGESFYSVAQQLGLDYTYLVAANPTLDPLNLPIGQVIKVPVCK